MKLVFNRASLLQGVNIVLKAVPSKTTMPILECILIDASTNEIKFTTNDMELGIETKVAGEIIERGKIAIDAKMFSDIVRKLPDNEVMLETDDNYNAIITCEKSKFNIASKSGDDFSYIPYIERDKFITLSQFGLKEVIRQTIFSISDNESKKLMTGELFEVSNGILKVVSLDGHRISIRKLEIEDKDISIKVIVPGKTLIEISKILSSEIESKVNLYFTNNHILFEFDNTLVVSRLIEGEYFKIDQMMSSDYETHIIINKKEFLNCIDRSTLLIKEGEKKPIIIGISDGVMELKVNSPLGSMNEEIDINKNGKDIMIGFNPKFLMDALRVIDDEEINIYLVNSKAPCFIRDNNESYTYLILPVNFTQI
jgi:DNA polymerase-3 subunit beta